MALLESLRSARRALYPSCGCLRLLPTRYLLCLLLFFGLFNVYSLRIPWNVALVQIIKTHPWDKDTLSLIQGSFYIGYILTNVWAGRLAELYGGNAVFGLGIVVTSLLNLLTPLAVGAGSGVLVLVRILEGVAEGVTLPAMYTILGRWCPKSERTVMRVICESGLDIGTIAADPLTGYLCGQTFLGGWPSVFYVFGIVGVVWWVLWLVLAFETPSEHPWITEGELDFILKDQGLETPRKRPPCPWYSILTSPPFWSLAVGVVLSGFFTILIRVNYPVFLQQLMNFDMERIGWVSSLPSIVDLFISLSVGFLGDYLIARYSLRRRTLIRKSFNVASTVAQLLAMGGAVVVGERPMVACVFISLGYGLNAIDAAGAAGTIVDMSPVFAGSIYGILNALGNLSGIVAPYVVNSMTQGKETSWRAWYLVFAVFMALNVAATLVFVVFGSSDLQPWGLEGDSVSCRACCGRFSSRKLSLTASVTTIPVPPPDALMSPLSSFPSLRGPPDALSAEDVSYRTSRAVAKGEGPDDLNIPTWALVTT